MRRATRSPASAHCARRARSSRGAMASARAGVRRARTCKAATTPPRIRRSSIGAARQAAGLRGARGSRAKAWTATRCCARDRAGDVDAAMTARGVAIAARRRGAHRRFRCGDEVIPRSTRSLTAIMIRSRDRRRHVAGAPTCGSITSAPALCRRSRSRSPRGRARDRGREGDGHRGVVTGTPVRGAAGRQGGDHRPVTTKWSALADRIAELARRDATTRRDREGARRRPRARGRDTPRRGHRGVGIARRSQGSPCTSSAPRKQHRERRRRDQGDGARDRRSRPRVERPRPGPGPAAAPRDHPRAADAQREGRRGDADEVVGLRDAVRRGRGGWRS